MCFSTFRGICHSRLCCIFFCDCSNTFVQSRTFNHRRNRINRINGINGGCAYEKIIAVILFSLRNEIGSERFTSNIGKIGSFTYSLDDKIRAKGENSEALLRLVNLESGTLPFEKIISLYIGVGGL
jgi:hypothetical protein